MHHIIFNFNKYIIISKIFNFKYFKYFYILFIIIAINTRLIIIKNIKTLNDNTFQLFQFWFSVLLYLQYIYI